MVIRGCDFVFGDIQLPQVHILCRLSGSDICKFV